MHGPPHQPACHHLLAQEDEQIFWDQRMGEESLQCTQQEKKKKYISAREIWEKWPSPEKGCGNIQNSQEAHKSQTMLEYDLWSSSSCARVTVVNAG